MSSIEAEILPLGLVLMNVASLLTGYAIFRTKRKLVTNYLISQILGTLLIGISILMINQYFTLAGIVLVVGFIAELGVFPFLWIDRVLSNSDALTGLMVCSQISIVLLMSFISRDLMNQNSLLFLGILASLFSAIIAIYEKKAKGSASSVIAAQTGSMLVSLYFLSPVSALVAVISDLLAKFTILFSEERRDDMGMILAAVYLAELPPFPTFVDQLEIMSSSLTVGLILEVLGLFMMIALLLHRVKGGKSIGARVAGAILIVFGLVSLMRMI